MIIARQTDKDLIIDLLVHSFWDNKSVNYIVKQDHRREQRLRALMNYSFDMCHAFGKVYLSDDRQACALLLFPEQKRTSLKTIFWDLRLVLRCTGVGNLGKVFKREKRINKLYPKEPFFYLWFIGVATSAQGAGKGSKLLQKIIAEATQLRRPIYLETSREENVSWYQRFGFVLYNRLYFDYVLHCLHHPVTKQQDEAS